MIMYDLKIIDELVYIAYHNLRQLFCGFIFFTHNFSQDYHIKWHHS
jgi:hypothetical protein